MSKAPRASRWALNILLCCFLLITACKKDDKNDSNPVNYPSLVTIVASCKNNAGTPNILLVDLITTNEKGEKKILGLFGRLVRFKSSAINIETKISSIFFELNSDQKKIWELPSISRYFIDELSKLDTYADTKDLSSEQIRDLFNKKEVLISQSATAKNRFDIINILSSLFVQTAIAQNDPKDPAQFAVDAIMGVFMLPSCSLVAHLPKPDLVKLTEHAINSPCDIAIKEVKNNASKLWGFVAENVVKAMDPNDNYSAQDLANDTQNNSSPAEEDALNDQKTEESGNGGSWGDPHLSTFDGVYYDFQGYGEFIAVKSTIDDFEVQVRQEEISPYLNKGVTMNTAIGINTGNDRFCVYPTHLYVNNQRFSISSETSVEFKVSAGSATLYSDVLTILTPRSDIIKIRIIRVGETHLDFDISLNDSRKGKVSGLLGNFDSFGKNDIQTKIGKQINPYAFTELYPDFSNSWRVNGKSSLFVYEVGKSTESYTRDNFPKSPFTLSNEETNFAKSACISSGVTQEPYLSACIIDVALSGNQAHAISSLMASETKAKIFEFKINNFTSFDDLDLVGHGNAHIQNGDLFLTKAQAAQAGSVYKRYKVDISTGFEIEINFSLTDPGGITDGKGEIGADGIVLILQDFSSSVVPPAIGNGIGYARLPRSFAIELDNYTNAFDTSNDIWINTQGIHPNSPEDNKSLIKPDTRLLPNITDQKRHKAIYRYTKINTTNYKLEVLIDDDRTPYLTANNINIQNIIGALNGQVYLGLSSATDAAWQNHIIHKWTFKALK